ncbi:MbtH family protein [Streptomyces sp. NPDC050704]|uniref:MbtH family protein n=1 Tax=Streptomyces sp. NPDC050704 TaxID=3157219 RepID=UPI00342684BC
MTDEEDDRTYHVVVNHEEQYSIWLDGRDVPSGWSRTGVSGSRQECLDHIERVWTDIRPLSVRRRLERAGGESHA